MTPKECEQIYKEAYRAVYWTAMALMKNEADAEDVVQETFVTLIERYDTLQDKSKVVPWLKKICANKCLNLLTRTKTQAMEQEFFDNIEAVPEDFLPESILESQEKRKIIMDIIERALPEDVRRTIILFYFDEMSTKEIAEAMGVPQGTVLWRLSSARGKIKKEVEKYEKDNDIKLYAVAVPFLTLLFIRESEQVPLRPMPASLTVLSASAEASIGEAATAIATEAIEKGTGIMIKKLIIFIITTLFLGAAAAGIYFATRDKDEESPKNRKTDQEIETTVTGAADEPGDEPEFGSEEYWLSQMYLVDANDEAALRKIADTLMNCEPKLGEDKQDLYAKVVASIGKDPMGTSMWSNQHTFDFEFSFENGYEGHNRLVSFGYWRYETEPCEDVIADPGKVIAYDYFSSADKRKGIGDFTLHFYDEASANKAYDFYCRYITEYYAEYNPIVKDNSLGYFLETGDGRTDYAYVRLLHKDGEDLWRVGVVNYFADPDLTAAWEELYGKKEEQ
ncbi:MAG: sigma-70 family RNA polymerase sigma factor [Lachnospiraceae bacterium]|nr:sigma-70 family RNA polymerase sigma factor [Lachnospiraceae bacterium]